MSLRAVACRLGPVFLVVLAVLAAAAFATLSPGARRTALAGACPASGPPCPANAFLSLSVTAGGPSTSILVNGGSFLPGESMSIYWDSPSKVIGSATADGHGNFSNLKVKPFAGERPGTHTICASVAPQPCATFLLQGSPTPTPSSAASPSESPSPEESPSPSASPSVIPIPAGSTNGLDLILKPPLVFLPLAGLTGVVLAVAWWLFSVFPRQQRILPAASVVHRSTRPTWGGETAAATLPGPAAGEVETERPAWPDFPEGTDERPHWAPPQPPQPDEPEDPDQPEG